MASRYVVYGAGAVGGAIGGRLFQHGHDVALIARGDHARACREQGLLLRSPESEVRLRVPTFEHPSAARIQAEDIVILATKTQHSAGALDALREVARDATVVCAQNGVENERLAARRFSRVYAMCVMLPATHLEPGVVDASSAPVTGILDVGRYPSGVDETVSRVAADLGSATFSSEADPSIMRRKYRKLLMNLGNALEAACGSSARGSDLAGRARGEALACLAAAGIDVASDEEDAARRGELLSLRPVGGQRRGGGSTWQSLARGTGSTEADYLNGEVVLLGRLHGVPTPVNRLLQDVANRMARNREEPGSVELAELEAALA